MNLTTGTHLGPYEITSLLGAGGMGEVYCARDPRLGREVAVKLVTTDGASSPDRLRRFETEARAAAQLAHPNVVTVFDVGTHEGHPYLVLELLDGESLRETLRQGVPLLRQAVAWTLDVARGLGAAHERGIVHRDLKPENLFLTTDGRVKVLDFGLAKLVRSEAEITSDVSTAAHSTPPGQMAGTVLYMSPEQARAQPIDVRSDVFSFGVVLHELLAGKHPFRKDTVAGTLTAIVEETPPSLETLGRAIPPAVAGIVRRCLEKAREGRYESGHDVVVALEAVLAAPSGVAALREVAERSPYPGLSSFTEKDAAVFFGREREVEELWGRIRNRKLLAVIGPSGAGKTSFVRAGVLPARPEGWAAVVSTPGTAPERSLARALAREVAGDPDAVERLLHFEDADVVVETVSRWRERHGEALLVVDQFEELLTLNPPETQERFSALLRRLAEDAGVRVLLALRDDFLLRCCEQKPLAPVLEALTALLALGPEDLRRAIEEPAKRRGYRLEDEALVDEMVESVEGARAALPLLAFAVSRLWERRDRENGVLTRAAYEAVGGVAGALAQHAEATLDQIGLERHDLVREIFRNLVTAQGTRAVMDRDELLSVFPHPGSAGEVLGTLIDARLLTSYEVEDSNLSRGASSGPGAPLSSRGASSGTGDEGSAAPSGTTHRIEIVHESLLKAWPRLVRWQTQDEDGAQLRDQLKQAAHLWEEKERTPDLLWTGTAYREYELWHERYGGALTALEEDFAVAMAGKARRRKRLLAAGLSTLIVALAGVAVVIGISRHQAMNARDEAKNEALRAEAGKLFALGRAEIDRYPTAALAYARRSLELADTPEARRFAVEVLWRAPVARILSPARVLGELDAPESPGWEWPVISPDARWLAIENRDLGRILVVPHDGGAARTVPRPSGTVYALSFGPNGDILAAGGPGSSLQLWSLPGLREVGRVELGGVFSRGQFGGESFYTLTRLTRGDRHRVLRSWSLPQGEARTLGRIDWDGIVSASLDPKGHALAYAAGRSVSLLPIADPRRGASRLLGRHPTTVEGVVFSHVGDAVASVDKNGDTRVWSLGPDAPRRPRVLQAPKKPDTVLAVDGNARHLAREGGVGGNVRLWDLRDPPDVAPTALKRTEVVYGTWAVFDSSGRWLYATNSFTVAFWPVTGHWRRVLPGDFPGTWRLAFTPDGRWLASCDIGRPARLWPMTPEDGQVRDLSPESCWGFAIHPAGTHVLSTTYPGRGVFLGPTAGGVPLQLRTGWEEETASFAVAFDARGRQAITCPAQSRDPDLWVLKVWDLEEEEDRTYSLVPHTETTAWCEKLAFVADREVLVGGDGGVFRVTLPDDPAVAVSPEPLYPAGRASFALSPDRRRLLLWAGRNAGAGVFEDLFLWDLAAHTSRRITTHGQRLWTAAFDPSGHIILSGDIDGVVRAGPVSGEDPHLLLGHDTMVKAVAVSPDGRWIASVSDDGLSLWPMPDVAEPPLHALPHLELMAKLDALTNQRVVRDPDSSTGWKLDVGPFPGWEEVPEW